MTSHRCSSEGVGKPQHLVYGAKHCTSGCSGSVAERKLSEPPRSECFMLPCFRDLFLGGFETKRRGCEGVTARRQPRAGCRKSGAGGWRALVPRKSPGSAASLQESREVAAVPRGCGSAEVNQGSTTAEVP